MNLKFYFAKLISKIQLPAMRNCKIDKNSRVAEKCQLQNVEMDKYSYIGREAVVSGVKIGKFCSIGGYGQIGGGLHPLDWVSTSPCFTEGKSTAGKNFSQLPFSSYEAVEIGNDVWIGVGVYIKSGVKIGDGAVIGAHSVVTHDVEPYSIVAGSPAREIRKRFDDETIQKLLKLKWWNWEDDKLQEYGKYFNNIEKLLEISKVF